MNNKIILILSICTYLNLFSSLNGDENILENIKKKSNEIRTANEHSSVFQATDGQNVKRAISHENAGLTDEARLIFEQIFNEKKTSSYIFSNYKNFLKRQEDWKKLIEISREYANSNKESSNAMLALAENLLYVSGKNPMYKELGNEGYQIINNLIKENLDEINRPINLSKLERYISRLMYYDKDELAILKVNQIRAQYGFPNFYSQKLGKHYLLNNKYQQSIDEFILCLTNTKELNKYINNEYSSIRNQFARFPDDDNVKQIIIKALTKEPSKIKGNVLAEYKFKWKDYDQSTDLMIKNYYHEKSLYDFSVNMMKEAQFSNAEKIFNFLVNLNDNEITELSIFQLATILEIKSKKEKIHLPISDRIIQNSFLELDPFGYEKIDFKSNQLSKAIMMYDSLITKYNNSKAKYKVAEFKSMTNTNYNESISDFIDLEKSAIDRKIRFQSAIKIIDISIESGAVDKKLLTLIEKYKNRYQNNIQEDYLDLKRYQVLFYLKNFDELTIELNEKLKQIEKDNLFYNEFLDGVTLIMLFNKKDDELSLFSEGLFEIKKRNYSAAITKFDLLSKSTTKIINNICSYYLGYIYINLHDYSLAKNTLSSVVSNNIFSELALLLSAELHDYVIKDINAAADGYMNFMGNFESSIFYQEIRLRLEEIIG